MATRTNKGKRKAKQYNRFGDAIQESSSDQSSDRDEKIECWKDEKYWALPANVRNAIDMAQMKKKHSDFYYRLRVLTDKIHVFTSIFYNKMPTYQVKWIEKKKKDLEEKLKKQRLQFQDEVR